MRYGIFFWDDRRSESPRRLAGKLARRYASQDGQRRLWSVRPQRSERWTQFWNQTSRQAARSIHFISFSGFVLLILARGIMVFVTGLRQNTNHMFAGVKNNTWTGLPLFVVAMAAVGWAWWIASPFTIRHARLAQRTGPPIAGWIRGGPSGGNRMPS